MYLKNVIDLLCYVQTDFVSVELGHTYHVADPKTRYSTLYIIF